MEQQLARLKLLVSCCGLDEVIDRHILYPGHRRQHVVRVLMNRILGRVNVDEVPLPSGVTLEGLSEDERFAERCKVLLQMLHVPASAEQIRGCSGDQQQDTELLIRMAQLLGGMQQQRSTRLSKQQAAAADASIPQFLCTASQNLGQLTGTSLQLFASDMNELLQVFSERGALQQTAQLQQQVTNQLQQLQQQLQQMLADGGSDCQTAGTAEWRQQLSKADSMLDGLLQAVQEFHTVYQQELSVWADAADPSYSDPTTGFHSADNTLITADSVGRAAQHIVTAYQGLNAALEGFNRINKQHQALQDVPAGLLQEQRAAHHENASQIRQAVAALKPFA